MKTLLALIALGSLILTLSFAPTQLSAQTSKTCTCADRDGLIDLLNQANAALDTLSQYAKTVKPTDMVSEVDRSGGPTKGEQLEAAIQQAKRSVASSKATTVSCGNYTSFINPKETILSEYIKAEQRTYQSMVQGILNALNSLPTTCRPADWFGTISASRVSKLIGSKTIPPINSYEGKFDKGGEEKSENNSVTTGTIWLSGNPDYMPSSWQATMTLSVSKRHTTMMKCRSADDAPLVSIIRGTDEKWDSSGALVTGAEVSLNTSDDRRSIYIDFSIPEIDIAGTYSKVSIIEGGCGEEPDKGGGNPIKDKLYKLQAAVQGDVFPGNPEKASGTKPVKLPAFPPDPGVTVTDNLTVTFHLYRFHD